MNEDIKGYLVASSLPIMAMLAAVAALLFINWTPLARKIKLHKGLAAAKAYFLLHGGVDGLKQYDLWFEILEEALKSELDPGDLKTFISKYLDKYVLKAQSSGLSVDKQLFLDSKILEISKQYINLKQV